MIESNVAIFASMPMTLHNFVRPSSFCLVDSRERLASGSNRRSAPGMDKDIDKRDREHDKDRNKDRDRDRDGKRSSSGAPAQSQRDAYLREQKAKLAALQKQRSDALEAAKVNICNLQVFFLNLTL